MKRLLVSIIALAVMGLPVLGFSQQLQGVFSKPIVIGGENPSQPTTTRAMTLEFIGHPRTEGAVKFTSEDGAIELEGLSTKVSDVVAAPGYAGGETVQSNSAMIEMLGPNPVLGGITPLNGIGTDDYLILGPSGEYARLGLNYALRGDNNVAAGRLTLADIRVEEGSEFYESTLGVDPLETFMLEGNQAVIVADATASPPYDGGEYPAAVIDSTQSFQYCLAPRQDMPWVGFQGCEVPISDNEYDEVIFYDVADVGNGLVAPAYDPFLVYTDRQWYIEIDDKVNPKQEAVSYADHGSTVYFSPLALFRKVGTEPNAKYRFSGYTSFELPMWKAGWPKNRVMWPYILTNWVMPVALNPIAIEAIDMGGASSWKPLLKPASALDSPADTDHPDTDVIVAYRNALLDLDATVLGARARPAVLEVGPTATGHKTYRDIVGVCSDMACTSIASDLTNDVFPEGTFSVAVFWMQMYEWLEEETVGEYINMNPSHVFEPVPLSAMIGPNTYDMAVLTDFPDDATGKRRQYALVPSGYYDDASDTGIVYVIHAQNKRLGFKSLWALDMTSSPASCQQMKYKDPQPTALIVPDVLRIERPAAGYVPYQVETGNLDGDMCEDFLITWRAKGVVADASNDGFVKFDDGDGRMFSNTVTVGFRKEQGGACPALSDIEFMRIEVPASGEAGLPQVASATIGRFLSEGEPGYQAEGMADIVAGNAVPENNGDGSYSAYAYLFKGSAGYTTLPQDMERFRVGFDAANDLDDAAGVALLEADTSKDGPDALSQIVGRPLMLPEIGCPNYSGGSDMTVASVYETYLSINANLISLKMTTDPATSSMYEVSLPFRDNAYHPLPIGCTKPAPQLEPCVVQYEGETYHLPFFAGDECCIAPCQNGMTLSEFEATDCYEFLSSPPPYAYFSCELAVYTYYAWPMTCAMTSEAPSESDGMMADSDDSGKGSDRDTDFAFTWRPDVVVGYDGHAIAVASELRLVADATFSRNASNFSNARQLPARPAFTFEGIFENFVDKNLDGDDQAKLALSNVFRSPEVRALVGEFQEDLAIRTKPDGLFGPPMSFDDIFLIPIYQNAFVATSQVQTSNLKDSAGGLRSLAAGCSLVGGNDAQVDAGRAWERIVNAMTTLVDRVTDLFVADVDAQVCGNNIHEAGEECDFSYSLSDGCPIETQCLNDSSPNACTCGLLQPSGICGDGVVNSPEQCDAPNSLMPCGAGMKCVNCQCVTAAVQTPKSIVGELKIPKGGVMPGHREMTVVLRRLVPAPTSGLPGGGGEGLLNNDCIIQCATFPDEVSAEKYKQLNDEIRQITGRMDDFVCPPQQGVTVLCRVDSASAPELSESDLSLSLAGTPVQGPGNVRPYSVVQSGGSEFIDETTLEYLTFETVDSPILLVPLEGEGVAAQVIPDIASSIGATPMAATSVMGSNEGTIVVNNMYSHRVLAAGTGDGVGLELSEQPDDLVPGTSVTLHEIKFRAVNTGAYWSGIGGQEGLANVEDRIDWAGVKAMMQERVGSLGGSTPRASIYVDDSYPVVPNQRYGFTLYQDKYASAGQTPESVEVPFGFIVGEPTMQATGGGCGCFVSSVGPTAGSVLPLALAMLVPFGGIAYGRFIRRRRR